MEFALVKWLQPEPLWQSTSKNDRLWAADVSWLWKFISRTILLVSHLSMSFHLFWFPCLRNKFPRNVTYSTNHPLASTSNQHTSPFPCAILLRAKTAPAGNITIVLVRPFVLELAPALFSFSTAPPQLAPPGPSDDQRKGLRWADKAHGNSAGPQEPEGSWSCSRKKKSPERFRRYQHDKI